MNTSDLNKEITKLIDAAGTCTDMTSSERAEMSKRLREARAFGYDAERNAARRTTPVYNDAACGTARVHRTACG